MKDKNINKLITEVLAIEEREAKEAGALGFMARALVQATLPHKKPVGNEFIRKNGSFTLTILAPSDIGLPYGSIPRLLLTWLSSEAVKTKQRELILGDSLSDFMRQIGLTPSGGARGDITRLRTQAEKLFESSIRCRYVDSDQRKGKGIQISDEYSLWNKSKNPEQVELFPSTVTLSESFFREITENPVPIDLRAIKALKRSPLALDIYSWLTYRMSYLRRQTVIPWEALELQFGAEYGRTRDFKKYFIEQLRKVLLLYPAAKVAEVPSGLELKPSLTHIHKTKILLPK